MIIENHKWVEDISYYEGPLLSLFKEGDIDYLYLWVDAYTLFNRWLVFKTEYLQQYYNGEFSLLELILYNDIVYLVDIDADIKIIRVQEISSKNLPDDYLPTENSFYKK